MKTKIPLLIPLCALAFIVLSTSPSQGQATKQERPNAAGTWKWSVTTQDGQLIESSVALKQDGEKLTGTNYRGRGGEAMIEDGVIKGNHVSFKVTRKREDQSFTIKYDGKIEGDRIKGTVVLGDGDRTFEWNAKRESATLDPTGTWKWSMLRENGEKLEATMKLKREGEKLTGSLNGDDWTVELQNGRVQGEEIAFQASHERDGQKIVSKSKGKISGNSIKGTVEFTVNDQNRVREWEAQRQ